MLTYARRTATEVRGGRVRHKNNWRRTPLFPTAEAAMPAIFVERPGRDARHVVRPWHVRAFLPLVPEWPRLVEQLDAIVLCAESPFIFGSYRSMSRAIRLCAWPRELSQRWNARFVAEHRHVLDALQVPIRQDRDHAWCDFSEGQARAFTLVNVLVHELGHHRDRLNTRSQLGCPNGEPYADGYANWYTEQLVQRWAEIDPSALGGATRR